MMAKPVQIELDSPKLGGKIWLLDDKGLFVLERGPGVLRTIACTHAGTGSLAAFDGVPDENGFFPDHEMEGDHPDFYRRNGRPIYRANPVVMGSWMCDGGFFHGLTLLASGGTDSSAAIASVVWMPYKERVIKPKKSPEDGSN